VIRGNRMSPTHANKKGVRYRYYVSQALLQNRKAEAGGIARVPAPEIENLVCDGVLRHLGLTAEAGASTALADRELIERHVARVIITPQALKVCLNPASGAARHVDDPTFDNPAAGKPSTTITLPWTAPSFVAVKGIIHEPGAKPTMKPESRDALLIAVAKARGWIDDIRLSYCASFAEIAEREALCERHIRLLAPLAFLSPRIIAAIVDGTAPADLTVTGLAKALPYSWAEQERRFGLFCNGGG
jgi:site-specific DNA recombinase